MSLDDEVWCRGLLFPDEDAAYEHFRQQEIDERNDMSIEEYMEEALEKDASMQSLIEAMEGNPLVQKALRQSFRVGFSAGALHATDKASEMLRSAA